MEQQASARNAHTFSYAISFSILSVSSIFPIPLSLIFLSPRNCLYLLNLHCSHSGGTCSFPGADTGVTLSPQVDRNKCRPSLSVYDLRVQEMLHSSSGELLCQNPQEVWLKEGCLPTVQPSQVGDVTGHLPSMMSLVISALLLTV